MDVWRTLCRCSFSAGGGDLTTAIGDLNLDGKVDLAVAASLTGLVVALGRGNLTFDLKSAILAGGSPWGIKISDFEGDRNLDIAVSDAGAARVGVFSGDGSGAYSFRTDSSVTAMPAQVVAADFNGDLIPDLATVGVTENKVSVLLSARTR